MDPRQAKPLRKPQKLLVASVEEVLSQAGDGVTWEQKQANLLLPHLEQEHATGKTAGPHFVGFLYRYEDFAYIITQGVYVIYSDKGVGRGKNVHVDMHMLCCYVIDLPRYDPDGGDSEP